MAADEIVDNIPIVSTIVNFLFPKDRQPNVAPSFQDRMASVGENDAVFRGIGAGYNAATSAPVIGAPLKFVLDFGNRTADSMFGAAQWGDSTNDYSFGSLADGWRRSWDSWGTPEHLSAGQLIGAELIETFDPDAVVDRSNPFSPEGYRTIDALSKKTWYGNIAGGVADLTAGFVSPVTGVGKVAKAARDMGSLSTLARVQATADKFNDAAKAGELAELSASRGSSFFRSMANLDANPESYAARLRDLAKDAHRHSRDNVSAMDWASPRMEGATEGAKRIVAETIALTKDMPEDMAVHVIGNTWLAAMGSARAADEVIASAPLVMDALANATAPPSVFGAVATAQAKMAEAFRTGGDVRLSTIIDETFNTPQKQATAKAIQARLERATADANAAKDFRVRMMTLKPQFRKKVNGEFVDSNFDTARLRESRMNAENQVKSLMDQLKAAQDELKGTSKEVKFHTKRTVGVGLDDVTGSARMQGAAMRGIDDAVERRAAANEDIAFRGRRVKETRVTRNWIEAEYKAAKQVARDAGKANVTPEMAGAIARLERELDAAKKGQDYAKLASARAKLVAEVRRGDMDGVQFDREMLARANRLETDARDAFASGPLVDVAESNKALGAIQERIDSLKASLDEAKADRDLLNQTPLNDPEALAKWRSDMAATRKTTKGRIAQKQFLEAQLRVTRRQLADDMKTAKQMSPTLEATNLWLADINDLGKTETFVGRVSPTLLEKGKTAFRDRVGRTYMYQTGEYNARTFFHVHPKDTIANIGTAYGRNAVNTHDIARGQQELGMYLRKSGVFEGDEIRAAVNEFIGAGPSRIAEVVGKYNDAMVERMLIKAGYTPDDVKPLLLEQSKVAHATRSYLTGRLKEADASGQKWVRTNEFPGDDASDAMHMIDAAFLRSHLADTVPFIDPHAVERFVRELKTKNLSPREMLTVAGGAIDFFNYHWKIFNLLRPALFFRNMMDTGLRASLLMGSMGTTMSTVNGTRNLARNLGVRAGEWSVRSNTLRGTALQRVGLRQGTGEISKQILGDAGVKIDIGKGGEFTGNLYDIVGGHATAASVAGIRGAATRGVSLGEGLLGGATPLHNKLISNVAKWDKYKANDIRWPEAYRAHAQALVASPTARKMMELDYADDAANVDDLVRHLFRHDEVKAEYNKLAQNLDMTREQFVEQLQWEMENMFPEPGMAQTVMAGKLKGKVGDRWIEEHFPREMRFDIPGYESILQHANTPGERFQDVYRKFVDKSFNLLMDEPDFWLVRHPVMVNAYGKQLKLEARTLLEARRRKFGDDAVLTADDIRKMDARSRTAAISTVKKYMYDSTYSTGLSQAVHRWAPFFNPWYDAMRAYSKLIYDDPARLQVMAGLWNAPQNISQWLPEPLVVDVNGNPLHPGQEPEQGNGERFFVINSLIGGKTPFGVDLKLRQSAFNTILMGQIPWLPGWGPTVTVPMAMAINSDEDVALALSDSKNPAVKFFMNSLWPEGQVPRTELSDLALSITPPVWRKVFDVALGGNTYWRNVQYGINQRYIRSVQDGVPFDQKKAIAEAEAEARSAGWIAVISQGIFGISAKSDVAGSFYADQMRQIQALDIKAVRAQGFPSQIAMFQAQFPEAAQLKWTFSKNETGINATVQAQSEALRLKALIEDNPEMGWFLVGSENVGGEFSQTAYNQQRMNTYGPTQQGRKVLDPGQVMRETLASTGWDRYLQQKAQLDALAAQYGLTDEQVSNVKKAIVASIGSVNPDWLADYNTWTKKIDTFYTQADKLAADPRLADRQDIGMYAEYRRARQEVLDTLGLKSLNGTGRKSQIAKKVLTQIGDRMAAENLGFQQMWERILSREVELKAEDANGIG